MLRLEIIGGSQMLAQLSQEPERGSSVGKVKCQEMVAEALGQGKLKSHDLKEKVNYISCNL